MKGSSSLLIPPAVIALAAFAACTPDLTCEGDWCGTVVIVSPAEPEALLPPLAQFDIHFALTDLLFWKLADITPEATSVGDSGFVPKLAQEWHFEDTLTIAFRLHPDARWHDGTPVTAHDVAFSFDVYTDPEVNALSRSRVSKMASVTARDSLTAVFHFRDHYPEQFFDAVYHMRILPRHLLDTVPRAEFISHPFSRNPVGNGPFRFLRWNTGESIELLADSSFFAGRPGLRRLVWRFTTDPLTMVTQLIAGEADILNYIGGPENIPRVAREPHLRTEQYLAGTYAYMGFNFRDPADSDHPHPLFSSRNLRRALTMALDREAILQAALEGLGEVPLGPVTRTLWIWTSDLQQIPFDVAGARRLLAELGWRDSDNDGVLDLQGRRLAFELLVPSSSIGRTRAAVILQAQLKEVGVDMTISELEPNTMGSRMVNRRFDAYFGAWQQDPSPASIEETWTSAGIGGPNYGAYNNPRFDRLVHEALNTFGKDAARAKWKEALDVINADAPAIWMYDAVAVAGIHVRFENVSFRSEWWTDIWTWRVSPSRMIDRDLIVPN